MKIKLFVTVSLVSIAASLSAADTTNTIAASSPFKTDLEKVSYCIGMNIGGGMKRQDVEVDPDILARGLKDALAGGPTLISEADARTILMSYQQTIRAKMEAKRKEQGEKNKQAGEEFLAANKAKPGVTTTASGLQYKVLTEGKGDAPKVTDTVKVNYRGTLLDGTEFDSSYKRGEPATFPLNGVIKGWTEGVQLMKPGAKYEFYIPSALAYGENAPPNIGPNSTLIFDVELLSVTPAPPSQPITSDIIRVPSAEEIKHGEKPETIKMDQLQQEMEKQAAKDKLSQQLKDEQKAGQTN